MNIRFLSLARQELDDAYAWYERQASGLGFELLDEIDRTVHRIKAYPYSCEEFTTGIRRALVNRFPYGLIYGLENDTIVGESLKDVSGFGEQGVMFGTFFDGTGF